jgi:hypothetical protein
MPETAELTPEAGRFIESLVALKGGRVINEIGDRLHALIIATQETNRNNSTSKGGKLVLEIIVAPFAPGQDDAVTVECKVKETLPRPALGRTIFFATDAGELTQQNPKQMKLVIEQAAQAQAAQGGAQ